MSGLRGIPRDALSYFVSEHILNHFAQEMEEEDEVLFFISYGFFFGFLS
jgi:hypothetical protein